MAVTVGSTTSQRGKFLGRNNIVYARDTTRRRSNNRIPFRKQILPFFIIQHSVPRVSKKTIKKHDRRTLSNVVKMRRRRIIY